MPPYTRSNESVNVCEIVGCFNCDQVQFFSARMFKTGKASRSQGLQKLWRKYSGYLSNSYNVFQSILFHVSYLKNVNFLLLSHNYQLSDSSAAIRSTIFNDGGLAIAIA